MEPRARREVMTSYFFLVVFLVVFLAAFFFAFIGWILDPVFHSLGSSILESDSLHSLFTEMYNMPLLPLTRFNNSIVMGAGARDTDHSPSSCFFIWLPTASSTAPFVPCNFTRVGVMSVIL